MEKFSINELIWPRFNDTPDDITLHTSSGADFVIKPGDRIVFPKQVEFLKAMMQYDAVLFGGAAGPGKSHALRWACIWFLIYASTPKKQGGLGLGPLNDANSPPVAVGMFCETYTALEDRQIGAFKAMPEWLGKYHEKAREFRLNRKYGGGIVKLRNLDDPVKYSSAEFALIAIDELTLNPEPVFNFLRTRRRWIGVPHCPLIAATNPGSIGHAWVYERFVNPETRIKPHYDEELEYQSRGYHFIQALPKDNPLLTKQYRKDLKDLPEKLRRALNEGDWTVFQGQFFNLDPFIHQVQDFEIPDHWHRYRAIDDGFSHPFVCLWCAVDEEGNSYYYDEHSRTNLSTQEHKKIIADKSYGQTFRMTVADPRIFYGESVQGNKTVAEILNDRNDGIGSLGVMPANDDRLQGWMALRNGFAWEGSYKIDKHGKPVVNLIKPPKIYVFKSCVYTWQSLTNIIHDDTKVEDVKKTKGAYGPGKGDDEADCVRYCNLAVNPTPKGAVIRKMMKKSMRDVMRDFDFPWGDARKPQTKNIYAKF